MKVHIHTRLGIIGILFLCILAIPAMATTLTVGSANIPAAGQSVDVIITGDNFPDGLFGYEMTASFSDPSIAEITGVVFPSWDTWGEHGAIPSSNLYLKGAPFKTASTNLPLVTLTVRGKAAGSTSLILSDIDMIDLAYGNPIIPVIVPGIIAVGGAPTTGSVAVTSSPAGAAITLDGSGTGQVTPYTFTSQTTGPHTVGVSLAGYQTATQTVTVIAGSTVPADFTLVPVSPTTGSLSITSSPTGAAVTVDGTGYGPTPVVVPELTAGSHSISLSMAGYQTYIGSATVTAGVETAVNVVLSQDQGGVPGYLTVFSYPLKATAAIDGIVVGKTPLMGTRVSPGTHTLTLSMTGYSDYTTSINIVSGSHLQLPFIILQRGSSIPGSLSVTSSPTGATLMVDGTGYGPTPVVVPGLSPGSHSIILSMAGYQTYSGSATVTAGIETPVNIVLTPVSPTTGSLNVTSSPTGATLTVDGTGYGPTPVVVPGLSPGSHSISLSKIGYQTYSGSASVASGSETPVFVVLTQVSPTTTTTIPSGDTGAVKINTVPRGVTIYLDNQVKGVTPVTIQGLSQRSYELKLIKQGFRTQVKTVQIQPGQTITLPLIIMTPL